MTDDNKTGKSTNTELDSIGIDQSDDSGVEFQPQIHQGDLDKWVKDISSPKGVGLFGGLKSNKEKPTLIDDKPVKELYDQLKSAANDGDRYNIAKKQIEKIEKNELSYTSNQVKYVRELKKLIDKVDQRETNIKRFNTSNR